MKHLAAVAILLTKAKSERASTSPWAGPTKEGKAISGPLVEQTTSMIEM